MKRKFIICTLIIAAGVAITFFALRGHGQSKPKRIYLSPDQIAAMKTVDEALHQIEAQYKEVSTHKAGLINGFAVSNKELGAEWSKRFKYTADEAGAPCYEEISASEQKKE
ncbi:MAG: hypothetical protein WBV94_21840 [Blastocatellia bacterium]